MSEVPDVSREQMNQFFMPLVGSVDNIRQFSHSLSQSVAEGPDALPFGVYNPLYRRLVNGAVTCVKEAAEEVGGNEWAEYIAGKAEVGIALLGQFLEATGNIYVRQASVPQELQLVCANVGRLVGYVNGAAYSNQYPALINRSAWRQGIPPSSTLAESAFARDFLFISKRSFAVSRDDDRQLHIDLRYPPRKPSVGNRDRCPATMATVERERKRSAIVIFSKTVAAVAISEIYPRYFTIIDSN